MSEKYTLTDQSTNGRLPKIKKISYLVSRLFDSIETVSETQARYKSQVRLGLLDETVNLVNYWAAAHLIIANALAYFFWKSSSKYYLVGLDIVITIIIISILYVSRLYERRKNKVISIADTARCYSIAICLAFLLGLTWATMPVLLFASSSHENRLLVVAMATGLISNAYVIGPLLAVSYSFAVPLIIGSFIGLARSGDPVALSIASLLLVYSIFSGTSVGRMSRLSRQRILDHARVEHQSETIGILLNEFEENTSDWLWETGKSGDFEHVSTRMAQTLGREVEELHHFSLKTILLEWRDNEADIENYMELMTCLAQCRPFREVIIEVVTSDGIRWLQLSGKPYFDQHGYFAGYRGVGSDVTQSREAGVRIAYLATRDALTGLSNRAMFHEIASDACNTDPTVTTHNKFAGLLYLDLDGFKLINDSNGHSTGDVLLRQVAERLVHITASDDHVFRLGGDEFAILLHNRVVETIENVADIIISALSQPYSIDGNRIEIGVSIGIAKFETGPIDTETLLRKADLALYSAKNTGKGRWQNFDTALEKRAQRWHELDVAMRDGLENGEMDLHYQPLVSLQNGRVMGCEALLRWTHPVYGLISPAELIPIAESTGFVITIGRWALRKACSEALSWPPHMQVAVNISSIHFRLSSFFEEVRLTLLETCLPPQRLEIEITESIFLAETPYVMNNLRALRELGVRVVLDDFGTGYSSLSYLIHFPVDKIKIDRAFVSDLSNRPECLAVIKAIMIIAGDLGIDVTVEGVETEQQAEILRSKECNSAQGFLYSPACPRSKIIELIETIPLSIDEARRVKERFIS